MKRCLLLLLLCATASIHADDWPGPVVKEVFSQSREWFVRITPGTSIGDVYGFASAPKGPYAKAEFYRRQADRSYRLVGERSLLNPIAPYEFFVTDRGYVTTIDNWANLGYGKIAVFYSPTGDLIKAFELKELFSAEEIGKFDHSVSSIWWRKTEARTYVREGQQSLYVAMDDKGTELIFETETGAWQFCQWQGADHPCRTSSVNRKWIGYVDPKPRP